MQETVLITGATNGIGYELALLFAEKKYNLVLTARNKEKLLEMKLLIEKTHSSKCQIFAADLSNLTEVEALVKTIKDSGIQIDMLVNNAGFGDFGLFIETSWEKELRMINLNITALTYLTKQFAKDMAARRKGRIMNLASTAAFMPGPLMSVYYATKAFVLSFSEALANELSDYGVTVTTLCPGPTESGFQAASAIENSRLVKGRTLPSSKQVAIYGYRAMMKGRRVAVEGLLNKIMVTSVRISPRRLITSAVRMVSAEV